MPDRRHPNGEARLEALRGLGGDALDEALGAWIDGELPEAEAEVLRERVMREPAVAARHAALSAVGAALSAIPVPEVSARLRGGLQARIARASPAAGDTAEASDGSAWPSERRGAELEVRKLLPLRVRRARPAMAAGLGLGLGLALAAGLALYLAIGSGSAPPREDESSAGPQLAERATDDLQLGDQEDSGTGGTGNAPSEAPAQVAQAQVQERVQAGAEPDTSFDVPPAPGPALDAPEIAARAEVGEIADAELAIALEIETLRDFELIDQLELLERLVELEDADARAAREGRG